MRDDGLRGPTIKSCVPAIPIARLIGTFKTLHGGTEGAVTAEEMAAEQKTHLLPTRTPARSHCITPWHHGEFRSPAACLPSGGNRRHAGARYNGACLPPIRAQAPDYPPEVRNFKRDRPDIPASGQARKYGPYSE
tara:strand:+ start:230 stop:634 length:405 start_codon:yes stop_codon:yes gene_type:complete